MRTADPSNFYPARRRLIARASEYAFPCAAFPLLGMHLAWFASSLERGSWFLVFLGCIVGLFLLDLVTGCVHWACDTWGDERTRWVGPGLVRSFREHHEHPRAMLEHRWLDVNRETLITTTIVLTALTLPPLRESLIGSPFWAAVLYSTFGVGCVANQLHYWSHAPARDVPSVIQKLQAWGILLSPRTHARHHRPPRTVGYCIATGWLNPLLDGVGVWRALERIVTRASGATPRTQNVNQH